MSLRFYAKLLTVQLHIEKNGFSVAELLLSLGFITTVILSVIGLTTTIHRTGQESADRISASIVADSEIQRVIAAAQSDDNFWDFDHSATPYTTGSVTVDRTEFNYEVTATTVLDGADELGTSGGLRQNRLKKVNIVVTWWDSGTTEHNGYGKLEFKASRLVSEVNE